MATLTKRGRGKSAKNKTPGEVYAGGSGGKRSIKKGASKPSMKSSVADRFSKAGL